MTRTIDTLQITNLLIKSGLARKTSEALASQFKHNEDVFLAKKDAEDKLATKKDIENTKLEIGNTKLEIEKLRTETTEKIENLKTQTTKEIECLRSETASSFTKQTIWLSILILSSILWVCLESRIIIFIHLKNELF